MKDYIKELDQRTKELEELKNSENFKEEVFNFDGSHNSPHLILYTKIIQKFFDTKNTEEIKDMNHVKETIEDKLSKKNISKKEYEEAIKIYKTIQNSNKWVLHFILFPNNKPSFIKKEYEEKLKEYEEKFKEHEDKFILDTLILNPKQYKMQDFIEQIYKLKDIFNEYNETDKQLILELISLKTEIEENGIFREYIEKIDMIKNFVEGKKVEKYIKENKDKSIIDFEYFINLKTEEEKESLFKILDYQYNLSKEEKNILEKEKDYMILTEYIYINKFDKLIKKTIHNKTQNRYISSSVAGTISSSSTEATNNAKYQKDDLLSLIKKEALSYALEGFLIGIRKYDISKGNQLNTYMTWWLEQRVIHYIEKDSSLNKATKKIDNLKNYNFEDAEEENFNFHKFDNIKYSNYNFHDIDDMSNSIVEGEENFFSFTQQDLVYDILIFFCKHKNIFLYHEYLLIKYDLLLENYIQFIDINPKQEIIDCFYEDINIFIKKIQKESGFENVTEFTKVTEFYKISELLERYFNVEHSEFLSIKRSLKQKFINMLNKIFTDTEEKEENY